MRRTSRKVETSHPENSRPRSVRLLAPASPNFDPKCYDLACAFLEDVEPREDIETIRRQLAQSIQNTIEGYLSHLDPEE
jgi:hypothetical protein